jgi:hypothetical protein
MPRRLSADFIAHIARIKAVLDEVDPKSMEDWEEGFLLDGSPTQELFVWECIASTYQAVTLDRSLGAEAKYEVFMLAFACSFGEEEAAKKAASCTYLDADSAAAVLMQYRAAATAIAAIWKARADGTAGSDPDAVPEAVEAINRGNYYDWQEGTVRCAECGWSGKGSDATVRESFDDGTEYECPQCGLYFGFCAYPLMSEVQTDPRADPADRLAADHRAEQLAQFERAKLLLPSQLPDLAPVPAALVWDVTGPAGAGEVVIRAGDRVIWREPSWYENYHRFGEVASILWQKYGAGLKDLAPSAESELDLYGDSLGSPARVRKVRDALARGEDPGV